MGQGIRIFPSYLYGDNTLIVTKSHVVTSLDITNSPDSFHTVVESIF